MSCCSDTIIYTIYKITCDSCGASISLDTIQYPHLYNRRLAVRSIGWSFGRNGVIKCNKCRTHFTSYVPE